MKSKDIIPGRLYAIGSRDYAIERGIVLEVGNWFNSGHKWNRRPHRLVGEKGIAVALYSHSLDQWIPTVVRPQDIRAEWDAFEAARKRRQEKARQDAASRALADEQRRRRVERVSELLGRALGRQLHIYGASAYDIRGIHLDDLERLIDLIPSEHFEIKEESA